MAKDEIWTPFDPNNDTYKMVAKKTGLDKNLVRSLVVIGVIVGAAYVMGK